MARKKVYSYGGFELGDLNGDAVAVRYVEGKRQRHRIGSPRTPDAAAKAALIAWVDSYNREIAAVEGQTVGKLWQLYCADRKRDGKRMANFDGAWKLLRPYYENLSVETLTKDVHRIFAEGLEADDYAPWTIHWALNKLRDCMRWAKENNHVTRPVIMWNTSVPEGRERVVTVDEVTRGLDAAVSDHIRLFILLALLSGARHRAICQLKWDRVDLSSGRIDFNLPKVAKSITDKSFLKGRAEIIAGPMLRAALSVAKAKAQTEYVIEFRGQPVDNVAKGFRQTFKNAGIKGVTPHTLRHSAATWAITAMGKDAVDDVARLLGHADVKTTKDIYVHDDKAKGTEAVVVSIEGKLKKAREAS